jgi:hypothetical protein
VLSSYWQRADPTLPVNVRQLAAPYHRQGDTEIIRTFLRSDRLNQQQLFRHNGLMGQSLFPTIDGSLTAPAQANVNAAHVNQVFGFRVQNQYSDNTYNQMVVQDGQHGHYLRFYPAKDADGKVMPNTWLVAMDYFGINYDYQDNIYLVTNMRPADPSAVGGVGAATAAGGIRVTWAMNGEATAHRVQRVPQRLATGTFLKINNAPVTATEFLDAPRRPTPPALPGDGGGQLGR